MTIESLEISIGKQVESVCELAIGLLVIEDFMAQEVFRLRVMLFVESGLFDPRSHRMFC